jgi:DNA-binding transcriptional LysR family regulator
MDTRLLRFFTAVYEQRNLTRAAEQCFVSQPNISNGIKQLEDEIGKSLFTRTKRGVEIKEEAHYLYPIAKRILGELSSIPDIFKKSLFRNKICIGIAQDLPVNLKSKLIKLISDTVENIDLDIRPISRECDFNLLIREWKFEEHLFMPIVKEDYVLCIPDNHKFAEREIIDLEDLKEEPFIHCPPCEAHQQCLSILSSKGDKWNTVANCATKSEVLTLLIAGLGITFLPEHLAKPWNGFSIKKYNGPKYYREIGLSYSKEILENNNVKKIIDTISKYNFSLDKL